MPRVSKKPNRSTITKPSTPAAVVAPSTKAASIIAKLKSKGGATLAEIMAVTGWQQHSVRGFLAGALKKRHGLGTVSEKPDNGPRRYRLK